ncbi:hypothetical protein A7D23_02605 [Dehalobacter sp. TeCB1]|jgi:hypothetical protein|nr:hypothetical protein A7D23_02605 [Dehalobacter sp. TeCB1]
MAYSIKNQNVLRDSYNEYLVNTGTKQRFISKETGICETILSHFKRDHMQLSDHNYKNLMNYLSQHK